MTVAELIAKLQTMNPAAEVRLEAGFDGMTGSGDLAHVEYDDDGAVLLRDDQPYDHAPPRPPPFTIEADGERVEWTEIREIESVESGRTMLPGERGAAVLVIDVEAVTLPPGEARAFKLTGRDGREFFATLTGEAVGPHVTRVRFPLPPFTEQP